MKFDKLKLANAFGLAATALWVLCSAFVAVFPDFSFKVTKWWLHGLNIDSLGQFHLGWGNFIGGGIALIISVWVIGYVLGWSLEIFKQGKE